jgi:hypothetical protein
VGDGKAWDRILKCGNGSVPESKLEKRDWVGRGGGKEGAFVEFVSRISGFVNVQLKCVSASLAESWNPSWSVSSILTGLLSFMVRRSWLV